MNHRLRAAFLSILCCLIAIALALGPVQAAQIGQDGSIHRAARRERIAETVALTGTTILVSVSTNGVQGNDWSQTPSISADGRFVAFSSESDNLVNGDSNTNRDIFVHDRLLHQTERVSIASDGTQGNYYSEFPSISGDGRYVAFDSDASNLIDEDDYGPGVFVRDRQTDQTECVSVSSDGTLANHESRYPSISGNGRYVAFTSVADNLVPEDNNQNMDIFIHDRVDGTTTIASVASDGTQSNDYSANPSLSFDGNLVAFGSYANNLVADDNFNSDVFIHNLTTEITERVSIASDGTAGNDWSGNPTISGDGSHVAFESMADNLVVGDNNHEKDVFVHNLQTAETVRVSVNSSGEEGNGASREPSISSDGRYVAFSSNADNLVEGDSNTRNDVFIHDLQTGQTSRVSVASDGAQANGFSIYPSISGDGQVIAFESIATNLAYCEATDDTNDSPDVFLHDRSIGLSSISGTVKHDDDSPFPGVTVSTSGGQTAQTDSNGDYLIDNMCPGAYSLSASLLGFKFLPSTRQFTLPPNAGNQNFTGQPLTYAFLPAITRVHCGKAFYEDFDEPNTRWPILENSNSLFNFVNGEYQIVAKNPNGIVAASPNYTAENFEVGVKVRNPGGKEGIYGIVFNLAGDWSHFYTFEIDADGYFGIWRYNNIRGWKLLLVNYSDFLNKGTATNNLKVRRDGALIEIYANGHLLGSIEDSTYLGRQYLGLMVSAFDQAYVDIRFDNFYITPSECGATQTLSGTIPERLNGIGESLLFQEVDKRLH